MSLHRISIEMNYYEFVPITLLSTCSRLGMAATIPVYPLDVLRTRLAISSPAGSTSTANLRESSRSTSNAQKRTYSTATTFRPQTVVRVTHTSLPSLRASRLNSGHPLQASSLPFGSSSPRSLSNSSPSLGGQVAASREMGAVSLFRSIVREEGAGALFRGLTPTLYAIAPFIALQQATYVAHHTA